MLRLSIIFCTVIIHRVVAHEDPPFRPNIPSMEMKPEYIELMVDCWDDEPEERPHFYRIVERLKKISGRYRAASTRRGGMGVLNKVLRREFLPRGQNLPLFTPFLTERATFIHPSQGR